MSSANVLVDVIARRGLRESRRVAMAALAVGSDVAILRLGGLLCDLEAGGRSRVGGSAASATADKGPVRADRVAPATHVAWAEAVAFLLSPAAFLARLGDLGAAERGWGCGQHVNKRCIRRRRTVPAGRGSSICTSRQWWFLGGVTELSDLSESP